MYRMHNDAFRGIGALGPNVHCLYTTHGEKIVSAVARDAERYGRGGPAGTQVCYRSTQKPPPLLSRPTSGQTTCLKSIYDIYGHQVCYTPIPISKPQASTSKMNPDDYYAAVVVQPPSENTPSAVVTVSTPETTPSSVTVSPPVVQQPPVVYQPPVYRPPVVQASTPTPAPTSTPSYTPTYASTPETVPEEEKKLNTTAIAVGGILAVVVVGGIAYAATRKKK